MEWDENKITVLYNVQILLNNMGESHNWLNKKIFGSNAKDKPKNDLWRTDQKTLPSKVINLIANVFNRSVDEIVSKLPTEDLQDAPGSTFGKQPIPDYGCKFQNKQMALEMKYFLLQIERIDKESFLIVRGYLEGIFDALKLIKKNANQS